MGPSGSGKTTVGTLLAERLGWRFLEGDAFHSAGNIRKMGSGIPLIKEDRRPWLMRIAVELCSAAARGENVVLACSALKEQYRESLRVNAGVRFVFLKASEELLRSRVASRTGHFVPVELVRSQMATLEEPVDEITVDAALPPERIADAVVARLS